MVWVDPNESDRTINVFARVMGAPQADRNLVTFSMNAGLTFHEPFLHRDDDTFGDRHGLRQGQQQRRRARQGLPRSTPARYVPARGSETYVEVTYQYQVTPWWQLQPDIQYVFNPGGGIANPNAPTAAHRQRTGAGPAHQHPVLTALALTRYRRTVNAIIRNCIRVPHEPVHVAAISRATSERSRLAARPSRPCTCRRRAAAPADEPRGFLETVHKHVTLTSTVPDNGDQNPYALVVAPVSAGKIQKDDVLVDNFNNLSNLQGLGTTIVDYNPATKQDDAVRQAAAATCRNVPGGVGLTTAMTMLKSGWVIVGSTPSNDGTTAHQGRRLPAGARRQRPARRRPGPGPTSTAPGATWRSSTTAPPRRCSSAWPASTCRARRCATRRPAIR